MRLWYRDRLQKFVLASFTATFAFSFVLLGHVASGPVPDLGVTMAGIAVTADLFLLLVYLDRFVHALRPVAVAAAMARSGLAVVEEMTRDESVEAEAARSDPWARQGTPRQVHAVRSGAIQAIHVDGILALAAERDLVCDLRQTVGDFVISGAVLADLFGSTDPTDDSRRIRGMIALGHERTIDQDPAFAIRIVVDIAIRALSPAVNDPTTATQMINHIGALLTAIGSHDQHGRGVYGDQAGAVRLTVPTRRWRDYLELGVSEIRQYGATSPQVCRRLRALLVDLEATVLPVNASEVTDQLLRLDRSVMEAFSDADERQFALAEDRQGVGGASRSDTRPGDHTEPGA